MTSPLRTPLNAEEIPGCQTNPTVCKDSPEGFLPERIDHSGGVREPYRLLDLFSGIGGFSLGLERTGGFKTVAFCEIEEFPRRVLAKHWPGVPIYNDVRTLTAERLAADGIAVDAVCGGFPCQDLSEAGDRAGIDGERSGLWRELARIVGEIRPRVALVENVPELLSGADGRWFGRVLGDLAALGYDAVWNSIQAADLGAAHIRDRVWIAGFLPDTKIERFVECWREQFSQVRAPAGDVHQWSREPAPPRVADGVSARMVQLRALGNAVVPQIPELIGRAILAADLSGSRTPLNAEAFPGGT